MGFENDNNFDKDIYVGVNERLTDFYKKHKDGRVTTEVTVVGDGIIVKASLYRESGDTQPAATGHSFLTDISGDKVGEYTETVAVGRALALMGFKVEKSIASSEEMTRYNKQKNKDVIEDRVEVKTYVRGKEEKGNDNNREVLNKAEVQNVTNDKESPKEETKLRSNRFRLPTRKPEQVTT